MDGMRGLNCKDTGLLNVNNRLGTVFRHQTPRKRQDPKYKLKSTSVKILHINGSSP